VGGSVAGAGLGGAVTGAGVGGFVEGAGLGGAVGKAVGGGESAWSNLAATFSSELRDPPSSFLLPWPADSTIIRGAARRRSRVIFLISVMFLVFYCILDTSSNII
jgi:hypothetical protein